jgi:hypothetical protein
MGGIGLYVGKALEGVERRPAVILSEMLSSDA